MATNGTDRRVVVSGVGVASPLGLGADDFWANYTAGEVGIGPITRYDPAGFDCRVGGQAPEYKINQHVPKHYRKAAKVMARDIELAVIAAADAFRSAGIVSKADVGGDGELGFDPVRFGCNIGAGLISCDLDELALALDSARADGDPAVLDLLKWGQDGMQKLTPLWLLKYLPNMLACHVTIVHGLMGPSNTITCADASSHLAIGEAYRTIQRDDADLAICGGAESKLNPMGHVRMELLGRLNTMSNDDPATALSPFGGDGSVNGEGGGLLILEERGRAEARGATAFAEVVGFGAGQDAHAILEPDPEGRSYAAAVRRALAEAGAAPADVDLLIPNACGHPPTDAAELAGLRAVFGDTLPPISTPKPQTGNLHAGNGQDVAVAVLALHHGTTPPAKNLPTDLQQSGGAPTLALATVTSLGGQHAALLLRKA